MWVELDHICAPVWPRPDLRSRSRGFWSCEKCTILGLSPPPFRCGAQNWWLLAIVWDLDYSLSEPDFWISFSHESSNFVHCRYFTKFKWPYFGNARCYSHVVGRAGSPTRTVYVDMTLTWFKDLELPTIAHNCTFLGLSPPPFSRERQNWWLTVILRHVIYSLSESDFRISFHESYHYNSNFAQCRYFTKFKRPYFRSAWCYSHMVGQADSPRRIVYVDVTLTGSKVKVTGLLIFRQLSKPCMLAGMIAAPLLGFLVWKYAAFLSLF